MGAGPDENKNLDFIPRCGYPTLSFWMQLSHCGISLFPFLGPGLAVHTPPWWTRIGMLVLIVLGNNW